ncbi:MAG: hypothetical protein H0T55_04855 [Rubrobacteraceae bacterium]|nr:hypothetical protein [Rubrobacteraceae bacterium]MBA3616552.1 hypothetical protein [Rubrobacteraceae bacterium]MDQ3437738.1 hypothetical protein [Actinomycetota bacterium]
MYEIRDGPPIKEVSLDRSHSRLAVRYGKETEERKERAMIARFDHRPMLTAVLALSTTVLLVVVVTLLITLSPAASPASDTGGGNPAAEAPANMDAGGENYGWDIYNK